MARVEIKGLAVGVVQDRAGNARSDIVFTCTGTVYAASSGGTTITGGNLKSNIYGELPGWLESGIHTITIPAISKTVTFEVGDDGIIDGAARLDAVESDGLVRPGPNRETTGLAGLTQFAVGATGARGDKYGNLHVGANRTIKHTGGGGSIPPWYLNGMAPEFLVMAGAEGRYNSMRTLSLVDPTDPPDLRLGMFRAAEGEREPVAPTYAFAVAAATDVLTIAAGHQIREGNLVYVRTLVNGTGLAVAPAAVLDDPENVTTGRYFARDVTATTLKVAATIGGAAVNVTADGTGTIQGEPADYMGGVDAGQSLGAVRWQPGTIPFDSVTGVMGHPVVGAEPGTPGSTLQGDAAAVDVKTAETPYYMGDNHFALSGKISFKTRQRTGPSAPSAVLATATAVGDLVTSAAHGFAALDRVMFALLPVSYTIAAATDLVTAAAHGYSEGDRVRPRSIAVGSEPLRTTTIYYVRNPTTNTFQVSLLPGGAPVNITSDGSGVIENLTRPASGLLTTVAYYVRNPTTNTFQLSTAAAGSITDITADISTATRVRKVGPLEPAERLLLHSEGCVVVPGPTLQDNDPATMVQGISPSVGQGDLAVGARGVFIGNLWANRPVTGETNATVGIGALGPAAEAAVQLGDTKLIRRASGVGGLLNDQTFRQQGTSGGAVLFAARRDSNSADGWWVNRDGVHSFGDGAGTTVSTITPITSGQLGLRFSRGIALWGGTPPAKAAAITAPTGGATIDAEARTAINALRAVLNSATGIGATE